MTGNPDNPDVRHARLEARRIALCEVRNMFVTDMTREAIATEVIAMVDQTTAVQAQLKRRS